MSLRVDPARAVLLVVDVQERLAAVMQPDARDACARHIATLIEMSRRLGIPVVVSEQYKKGLGPTIEPIEAALAPPGLSVARFEKIEFPVTGAEMFGPIFEAHRAEGRTQWLLTGMETHICVYQSARGLRERGVDVQVVADAVCSRTPENRALGLALCERAGALVTGTETVVFDALGKAGSDDFKALSKLIR
jgi:nicotinamidase-related amidase